jgi:hypothetical protein
VAGRELVKILVTGMTARQTRDTDSIAGFITKALEEDGHEVTCGKPSMEAMIDGQGWDHVYVGLGPLHGLGTSSMYGALTAIGTHIDKCTLYVDDLDVSKIGSGFRVMRNNPMRLVKPFYVYKREWEFAKQPEMHDFLMGVVNWLLAVDEWPRLLVPAFDHDDAFSAGTRITGAAGRSAVAVDWSAYMPDLSESYPEVPEGDVEDFRWWATEANPYSRAVTDLGPTWPVYQLPLNQLWKIERAAGFLAPDAMWTGRIKQVLDVNVPCGTSWRFSHQSLGEDFSYILAGIELMSDDELEGLVESQQQSFAARMPSREELRKVIRP